MSGAFPESGIKHGPFAPIATNVHAPIARSIALVDNRGGAFHVDPFLELLLVQKSSHHQWVVGVQLETMGVEAGGDSGRLVKRHKAAQTQHLIAASDTHLVRPLCVLISQRDAIEPSAVLCSWDRFGLRKRQGRFRLLVRVVVVVVVVVVV